MAQAVNIPLKSPINTQDDGLFNSEQSFDFKNSLVYRGIAENITYEEGDGILSTTSKQIKINGSTLEAGSQAFSLPSKDYFTVENTGSKSIGENEVAINGVVAGITSDYYYINDKKYTINRGKQSWVAPIQNTESFIFVSRRDVPGNTPYYDVYRDGFLWLSYTNIPIELGARITAAQFGDWTLIGFDDDDYRKRCVVIFNKEYPNKAGLIRGWGCVSNKGWVTGEPIPLFTDEEHKGEDIGPSYGVDYQMSKISFAGPNLSTNTKRYKVLDNGAVQVWTGFGSQSSYLKQIADENAALGATPSDKDTTQTGSGQTAWHWKIHSKHGNYADSSRNWDNIQTYEEPGYDRYSGTMINNPGDGNRYCYGTSLYSRHAGTDGHRTAIRWVMGWKMKDTTASLDFSISCEPITFDFDDLYYESTSNFNSSEQTWLARSSLQSCTVYGDWTYEYNSMKAYNDLTDYDGVFPFMRLFFNISGNRGKYFDYGPGWFKCYRYTMKWCHQDKQVAAYREPLAIITYNEGRTFSNTLRVDFSYSTDQKASLLRFNKLDANPGSANNYIDPLGFSKADTAWNSIGYNGVRNNLLATKDYWAYRGETAGAAYPTYNDWTYIAIWRVYSLVKRLEMLGNGKGIREETFNFGGLGDNTILGVCNHTLNITPGLKQTSDEEGPTSWASSFTNNDKLRLGVYQNLNMALSYNGTLLFNASDLQDKFHIVKKGDDYIITIFNDNKAQWLTLKKNGTIKVDKLTDYLFRVNVVGSENLLVESRDGIFSLIKGFNSFIGENVFHVADLSLKLPSGDTSSNNTLLYADGINTNLLDVNEPVSFLLPAKTIPAYCNPADMSYFETTVLKNRHGFIKNRLRNSNILEGIETYYTSLLTSADLSYKVTDKLPANAGDFAGLTGVQSFNKDMEGFTWWIDSDTVIYPVAIGSQVSGINYQTSTIDLPGNYAVRFYTQSNKTWPVYNQNAQVYFGNNIFTIMGSNYYFDGQGVYYLGDSKYGGATGQYSENVLIAYAIGMKYLCNAPSEAYFYSPFDRCLYIFTSSNTMQKSTSLARFGDILDSCYCPVNQSLYILFEGKLLIKTQDDMALIDVEGDRLQTTSEGVQVVNDGAHYTIHSPYLYDDRLPLHIETEWLGTPDVLSKYSYCDIVLFGEGDKDVTVDLQTIAGITVTSDEKKIHIKASDWQNNHFRIRLTAKEPVGNAFKIVVKADSDNKVGLWNFTMYMENVSQRAGAVGRA